MPDTPDNDLLEHLQESLEGLRSKIVDLEATAHAAAEAMNQLPYLPQRPRPQESKPTWTEEGTRNLGRMQSLVYATASAAESLLGDIKELIEDAYSDRGPDRGPSGGGGPSGTRGGPGGVQNGPKSPRSDGNQPPSKPAPARGPGEPHGQNGHGLRSMPGGIILDMRPIPPRL